MANIETQKEVAELIGNWCGDITKVQIGVGGWDVIYRPGPIKLLVYDGDKFTYQSMLLYDGKFSALYEQLRKRRKADREGYSGVLVREADDDYWWLAADYHFSAFLHVQHNFDADIDIFPRTKPHHIHIYRWDYFLTMAKAKWFGEANGD